VNGQGPDLPSESSTLSLCPQLQVIETCIVGWAICEAARGWYRSSSNIQFVLNTHTISANVRFAVGSEPWKILQYFGSGASAILHRAANAHEVGRVISAIGKKAGVVVNKADGKFASAHDLRRAFGTRWAKRVMPAILKRLMRHSTVQTTMGYYVDLESADVADQLWADYGNTTAISNTLGNTRPQDANANVATN